MPYKALLPYAFASTEWKTDILLSDIMVYDKIII